MIMVIAFMALSIPLITGSLAFASTLGRDSVVKTEILKRQYAALGGDKWGNYLIEEGKDLGCYTMELNGKPISTCIGEVPPLVPPPPPADNSRRFQTLKQLTSEIIEPDGPNTYTYEITVTNRDDDPENLNKIDDVLPTGFSYVPDSSWGVTSNDPSISGQKLTWTLSETLSPGDSSVLTFDAEAEPTEGIYCNEAWATSGGPKTGSGLMAKLKVGSPADDECPGAAVLVTNTVVLPAETIVGGTPMTFHYSIEIENTGTADLQLKNIQDLLPPGFTYVDPTSGLTTESPTAMMFQGRQRLTWNFNPKLQIPSGETETLYFDAEGAFAGGHWNDAWINFDQFPHDIYTWPSAGVQVLEATESTTIIEGISVYSLIWKIGPDTYILWEWGLSN